MLVNQGFYVKALSNYEKNYSYCNATLRVKSGVKNLMIVGKIHHKKEEFEPVILSLEKPKTVWVTTFTASTSRLFGERTFEARYEC